MSAGPLLVARGVTCLHPGGRGVDAVDLEVAPGEIVGLLGPNGAGKSTLVRAFSGTLRTTAGSVRLAGAEITSLSRREIARRLAVVPQEPAFHFPFSVLEVVMLGRHPHLSGLAFESPADVDLARAALARVGAESLADRPIAELSSGERQRVVLARALAQATPLLLLDEPASFLDLRHQVGLFDLLRELANDGRGILVVLHDLNLAAEYCDRLVLLAHGRVAASGPTVDVLTWANLTRVYGTEVYVDTNDLTGALIVTPLSARARAQLRRLRGEGAAPGPP